MKNRNNLKRIIRNYLDKIKFRYCDWDISKFLHYVKMSQEDFDNSKPQVVDSVDEVVELELWSLSFIIRKLI